VVNIRDPQLKAFCLRMLDSQLPESDWIESVGSFVADSPPSRWKDEDEVRFSEQLTLLVHKFRRVESVHFAQRRRGNGPPALRVAVTAGDGIERERVVFLPAEQENEAKQLEARILELAKKNDLISLAATSRVLWKLLQKDNHEQSPS
jgi:hypothetical protein